MKIRTEFKFVLPRGNNVQTEAGRKVSGTMRLVKVKDLVQIERDGSVQRDTGEFYVVLLAKVITALGSERSINRKTIEKLDPVDFGFLVDFLHEINHQVIKTIPLVCPHCGKKYKGTFALLGEA